MKSLPTYDFFESARLTSELAGSVARTFWSFPVFGMAPTPVPSALAAWGKVTERTYARMSERPGWGIDMTWSGGRQYFTEVRRCLHLPFCDLIKFHVKGRKPSDRKVLLVAPMSGHYATLIRRTVGSLLPDCDVFVTDWRNARDVPVSQGKFDIEDFTLYLASFIRHLGADTHVVAVCQPAPLALAAAALLAETEPVSQPRSLVLIAGPVVPDAAPTEVTDFGNRITMGQLENCVVQHVGVKHAGVGRLVYPGVFQLASFILMNMPKHFKAFSDQIIRAAKGQDSDNDRHNLFYDEYLAVMDLTAEFYLSTVERLFKKNEIAENRFTVNGRRVDLGAITTTAVLTVEGGKDDISAPGQCSAGLGLLTGLPDRDKAAHVEPDAGHYGIFAGKVWNRNIRPIVLDFIDSR